MTLMIVLFNFSFRNMTVNKFILFYFSFRNMTVKKIVRVDRRGNQVVTEEMFVMLFKTEFTGTEGKIAVHAVSLPIVVTVHGKYNIP